MDKGAKKFLGGLILVGSPALGFALEANLADDAGAWATYAIAFLVAFAALPFLRIFKVEPEAEFTPVPDHRGAVVTSSQWSGEMLANETSIKAAVLSCNWKENAWINLSWRGGVTLEVEREPKGWRFIGSSNGLDRDRTVVRSSSSGEPRLPPPVWNILADEPGDLFELSEVEQVFAEFAVKGNLPQFAKWQVINLD